MHIKLIQDIRKNPGRYGSKTLSLANLASYNLNVPKFVALDKDTIVELKKDPEIINAIVDEITLELPSKLYAVRSSALIEDGLKESYAGQFKTELEVDHEHLKSAIQAVIDQAAEFLKGDLSKFSIIIQQFINPDYAGVLFTRNPESTRDAVFEYYKGVGENLVSGKIKPEKIRFYWEDENVDYEITNESKAFKETFKQIEKFSNFPQDIEWCMKNSILYILQSRPITTISTTDFEQIKCIDQFLEQESKKVEQIHKHYYYYKNEISQIIPRPCNLLLDLLDLIYGQNGPIEKVYKKHRIKYFPSKFWKMVGNELFVEKTLELKTVLPGYKFDPKKHKENLDFSKILNLPRTFLNILSIIFISPSKEASEKIYAEIKSLLSNKSIVSDFDTALQQFLKTYETIFNTNLYAEKALHNLKSTLGNEKIDISTILEGDLDGIGNTLNLLSIPTINIQGNSLDLLDQSTFIKTTFESKSNQEFEKWFNSLSNIKRKLYKNSLSNAQNFNKLREICRWLTVISINNIRNSLEEIATAQKIQNPELLYFSTISEIKNNNINIEKLQKRMDKYSSLNTFNLPKYISSQINQLEFADEFISGDKLEGTIVDIDSLNKFERPRILRTYELNPSLTQYFEEIDGIISENGSLLSHLAIIAREKRLSVVVTDNINKYKVGDKINICKNLKV